MAVHVVDGTVERPVRNRPALAVAVIESLVHDIVTERYAPGEVLPTANVLGDTFAVSRTVVREAITMLAEKGLVTARQGLGSIVLDQSQWSMLDPMVIDALFARPDHLRYQDNLMETRATLEAAMAAKAAGRMTEEARRALDGQLEVLAGLVDQPERHGLEDIAFHGIVHRASGDVFGRSIARNILDKMRTTPQLLGSPDPGEMELTDEEHRRIRDALVAGDADGAAEAMRRHIMQAWSRRRSH